MKITLLRRAILGDAVFEALCAVIFVFGANTLASWTDFERPIGFVGAGLALTAVAALLYWMARQAQINLTLVRLITLLNAVFAVAGILALLIFWSSLTNGAHALLIIIVAFVGLFAVLEYAGMRTYRN